MGNIGIHFDPTISLGTILATFSMIVSGIIAAWRFSLKLTRLHEQNQARFALIEQAQKYLIEDVHELKERVSP